MIITNLYIARDADGQLAGHFRKPERLNGMWIAEDNSDALYLDDDDYPDEYYDDLRLNIQNLKFEDDPIRVEVVLKIDDINRLD